MKAFDEGRGRRRRVDLHARARRRDGQAGRPGSRSPRWSWSTRTRPAGRGRAVLGPDHAGVRATRRSCRWTTDLDDGLDGAGAVLLQLRVGGQAARQRDETWPLECGCVGQETTGAGGLAKALRTVPVVLDIAERARRRAAPDAWIIDFTNPVGIVTRALLDAGHRAVGLCNVAIGFQRLLRRHARRRARSRSQLDHVGLNHLTWERAVLVDGTDRLPELIAAPRRRRSPRTPGCPRAVLQRTGRRCRRTTCATSMRTTRWWPSSGARPTRAEEVAAIEQELLELYADPALDRKPELLGQRGGAFYSEAAVALLASLVGDTRGHPGRERAQRGHDAVPRRRRGDRGARGDRRGRRRAGARWRRSRPLHARPGRARVRVRGTRGGRGAARRAATGCSRRCSRIRWSASSTWPSQLADRLIAENRGLPALGRAR